MRRFEMCRALRALPVPVSPRMPRLHQRLQQLQRHPRLQRRRGRLLMQQQQGGQHRHSPKNKSMRSVGKRDFRSAKLRRSPKLSLSRSPLSLLPLPLLPRTVWWIWKSQVTLSVSQKAAPPPHSLLQQLLVVVLGCLKVQSVVAFSQRGFSTLSCV